MCVLPPHSWSRDHPFGICRERSCGQAVCDLAELLCDFVVWYNIRVMWPILLDPHDDVCLHRQGWSPSRPGGSDLSLEKSAHGGLAAIKMITVPNGMIDDVVESGHGEPCCVSLLDGLETLM